MAATVDEKAQLFKLTWSEKGGPAVEEPTRHSFGTRLIRRLADQLHGEIRLSYEPAGVVYELEIPLPSCKRSRPIETTPSLLDPILGFDLIGLSSASRLIVRGGRLGNYNHYLFCEITAGSSSPGGS